MLGLGNTLSGGIVPAAAASFTNTYSVAFDGTDDYIHVTNELEWMGVGTYTFWAKTPGNSIAVLFSSQDAELGLILYVQFFLNRLNIYNKYLSAGALQTTLDPTDPLSDDAWHHWAIVWDGVPTNSTMKLYVDGDVVGDHSATNGDANAITDGTLKIGAWSGQDFEGRIDEIGFWNDHSLSAEAVDAIYNDGVPFDLETATGDYLSADVANLTAYWRMGDGDTYPNIEDQVGDSDGEMLGGMTSGDIVSDVPS
tara:strand:+ start:298 stop:1056 length:759 start_codon:yes stop_codon:yes gene_type:complete